VALQLKDGVPYTYENVTYTLKGIGQDKPTFSYAVRFYPRTRKAATNLNIAKLEGKYNSNLRKLGRGDRKMSMPGYTTSKGEFPAMKQWRPSEFGPVGRGGEYLDELGGMCGHGSDVYVYRGRLRGGCSKGGHRPSHKRASHRRAALIEHTSHRRAS
jgi:hypothetical protein